MSDNSRLTEQERPHQLYGRQKSRPLTERKKRLLTTLLPRLEPGEAAVGEALDLRSLFEPGVKVWLEIGFGGGEQLLHLAAAHRHDGFVGVEPFVNGAAKLLVGLDDLQLTNVRVRMGDARPFLAGLTEGCVDEALVLYPDPWPKSRHHKRRLLQSEVVGELARVVRPGGTLRIASDIPSYVDFALENVLAHGAFEWTAERAQDWRERPSLLIRTRYEAKAVREGRSPAYLTFQRRDG